MTPEELIDAIITSAMATARTYTDAVGEAAEELIDVKGGGYFVPPSNLTGFLPEAIEPAIPEATDSITSYEAQVAEIVHLLSSELADFFDTYYPLENDAFDEATAWLLNTITNGGTGINADVEDQVWQRARERIIADGRRAQSQITSGFAAKGYFMPPGALVQLVKESLFDQTGKTSDSSTAIAAKQLDIEIETIKFAIDKAIASRQMAMAAAADYIKAVAMAPGDAIKVANSIDDNRARLMSAAADWYRARQGRDELVLRSKLAELETNFNIYQHRGNNSVSAAQVDATALAAAADALGRTAASALSSLNSIVSTSVNSFA